MKNWKRLSLVAVALFACNAANADNCNDNCNDSCNTDCNTDCNDGCSVDTKAYCKGGDVTSKSVYVDIGFGATGTYLYESLFRNDRMNAADSSWGGAFQAAIFGGKSTSKSKDEIGRRFGLNHQRCMVAAQGGDGANDVDAIARDIDVSNFNINTQAPEDFKSTICFCPEQKIIGALLNYRQAICRNDDDSMRWYAEVNLPIVRAKHSMGFSEVIENKSGAAFDANGLGDAPFVANMTEAFNQSAMKYGKIDNCDRSQTQLANAEFKVGYNSLMTDCAHLDSYLGMAFKNSASRCATYVFEPIVGQEHYAFMWGSALGFNLYNWEESSLGMRVALDGRYWFQGNELRSFDLQGKEWSRYMAMYANQEQATANVASEFGGSFGINVMTRCVDVTPGYQLNYNCAFVYEGCNFLAEFGHTLYARQHEEICPNWYADADLPALRHIGGDAQTTRAATISSQFEAEVIDAASYANATIKKCDVDWSSGAHEAVIGHTLYGTLGYEYEYCYPMMFSVGGAYDFAEGNSMIHRWTLFGKIGVSF